MKHAPVSSRRQIASQRRSSRVRESRVDRGSALRDTLYNLDCRLRGERDLLQRERLKATMAIVKNPQRRFAAELIARQVRVMNGTDAPADAAWLREFHDRQKQRGSP